MQAKGNPTFDPLNTEKFSTDANHCCIISLITNLINWQVFREKLVTLIGTVVIRKQHKWWHWETVFRKRLKEMVLQMIFKYMIFKFKRLLFPFNSFRASFFYFFIPPPKKFQKISDSENLDIIRYYPGV